MAELRKVESQQMDEKCPMCNKGWMRPTGIVVTGEPPQFEHACNNCGWKNTYPVRYPYHI
jgi:hypothetical protein